MASENSGPNLSFPCTSALSAYRRVTVSGSTLAYAGATTREIGTLRENTFATSTAVNAPVRDRNEGGVTKFIAAGAISQYADVYAAANGKVASTGTILIGTAMSAASGDGEHIEVLPLRECTTEGYGGTLTAAATESATNSISVGQPAVEVTAVTNDANDFIVLPAIASVPIGYRIAIAANAGGNFELRTPASSNTKINNIDSDGTQEYLVTDTDIVIVQKRTATDWIATSYTKLGAIRTAVIPD